MNIKGLRQYLPTAFFFYSKHIILFLCVLDTQSAIKSDKFSFQIYLSYASHFLQFPF